METQQHKAATERGTPSGTRTLDTLIKSQVLFYYARGYYITFLIAAQSITERSIDKSGCV